MANISSAGGARQGRGEADGFPPTTHEVTRRDSVPVRNPVRTAGRRAYYFDPRHLAAGVSRIDWDLTDRRGRRVASGLYFVRAWVDHAVVQTKLVVLR